VAVIIISHNLNDVFQVADQISVLYLGKLVANLDRRETTYDDVVAYITGTKSQEGN
jgi:D-xylose transport system ATP-binding protein